jgi:hypothetical protein
VGYFAVVCILWIIFGLLIITWLNRDDDWP